MYTIIDDKRKKKEHCQPIVGDFNRPKIKNIAIKHGDSKVVIVVRYR